MSQWKRTSFLAGRVSQRARRPGCRDLQQNQISRTLRTCLCAYSSSSRGRETCVRRKQKNSSRRDSGQGGREGGDGFDVTLFSSCFTPSSNTLSAQQHKQHVTSAAADRCGSHHSNEEPIFYSSQTARTNARACEPLPTLCFWFLSLICCGPLPLLCFMLT